MNRCENYIEHYRTDAEEFDYFTNQDPTDKAYEKLFRKFLLTLAGTPHTVLDIGSGSGWTSFIPHHKILFVDLSNKNLRVLKSDASIPVLADAHALPFKDESQEFVVASEIIEHLNDPGTAAREIWRVLKPGGRALVSTPYKERLRYTLCIHCNKVTPWNAHLHSFDNESLSSFFPEGSRKSVYVFGSKVLVLARTPKLFGNLPLWLWRVFDRTLIRLTDKAQHLVLLIEK